MTAEQPTAVLVHGFPFLLYRICRFFISRGWDRCQYKLCLPTGDGQAEFTV